MDFELTDEQKLVQKTAADFAKNEVLPKAAEIDRNHRHPKELVARMAALGLLGEAGFDAAYQQGRDLDRQELLALAAGVVAP